MASKKKSTSSVPPKGKTDQFFRPASSRFTSRDLPIVSSRNSNPPPSHSSSGFFEETFGQSSRSSVVDLTSDNDSNIEHLHEELIDSNDSWIRNMKSIVDNEKSILPLAPEIIERTVKMINDGGLEWLAGDLNVSQDNLSSLLEFLTKIGNQIENDKPKETEPTSSKRANDDDVHGLSYHKRRRILKDPKRNGNILEEDLFIDNNWINYNPVTKRFNYLAPNCPNADGKFTQYVFKAHFLTHVEETFICSERNKYGKVCNAKRRNGLRRHLTNVHKIKLGHEKLQKLNEKNNHAHKLDQYLMDLRNQEDARVFVSAPNNSMRKGRPGAVQNESPELVQIQEWLSEFDGKDAKAFQTQWEKNDRPLFSLHNGILTITGSVKDSSEVIVFLPFDNGQMNVLLQTKKSMSTGNEMGNDQTRKICVRKSLRMCRSNADSIGYGATPLPQFSVVASFCEKGTGTQGETVTALNEVKNLYRQILDRTGETNAVKKFTLPKCDNQLDIEAQALNVIQKYKTLLLPAVAKWKLNNN